jgi:hypothetical protein
VYAHWPVEAFEVSGEIWVKRRESWIPPVEGAAQHDERAL